MAQNIGSMALVLKTDSGPMQQGLQQAQGQISGWMTKINSNISYLGTGMWGAVVAGANMAVGEVKEAFDRIGDAADLAESLGVSITALQGLQHAAQMGGVGAEGLSGSLRKLAQNLASAQAGNAQAQAGFKGLGIEMAAVKGQTLDATLALVADRLAGIQDAGQRGSKAIALFGEQGMRLLPMLAGGSQGLADMRAEAERLGLALSETDAAAVTAAGDALDRVKGAISGVWNKLAVALAPAIETIGNIISEVVSALSPLLSGLGKLVTINFAVLAPVFKLLGAAITGLMAVLTPVLDFIIDLLKTIQDVSSEVASAIVEELSPVWDEISSTASVFFDSLAELFSPLVDVFNEFIAWLEKIGLNFDSMRGFVLSSMRLIAAGLSYLLDVHKMVSGGIIKFFVAPVIAGYRSILQAVAFVVKGLARVPILGETFKGAASGLAEFTAQVQRSERVLNAAAEKNWNTRLGDSRKAVDRFFDHLEARQKAAAEGAKGPVIDPALLASISELEAKLKDEAEVFGLTGHALDIFRLQQKGATADLLGNVRQLSAELEGMKLEEEFKSPAEKMQTEIGRLDRLLSAGAISWHTYSEAVAKAMAEAEKGLGMGGEIKAPSAIIAESREAMSAVIRHQMTGQTAAESPEARMQRILAEQTSLERQSLQTLRDIARSIGREPVEAL